jgi:pyruvate/2-oxoglutarate dehydrogenase complex dihydrolipoamide dehydrogenase (E3) component
LVSPSDREHAFDAVVVGAGPAGEVIAGRLADRGRRVALVERHLVGGECSFYACMPSKALLRPAEVLAEVARIPGAAQAVTGELDVRVALARRDEVIHDLDDSSQLPWLRDRGIELFRGEGRLEGERRVRVGDDVLLAGEAVVLAVGSGAQVPPIPGLTDVGAWSNREITTAREVPESLIVLGGGVVGVEMADAWSSFGTHVTLVEAADRLIAHEEPTAAGEVGHALREAGVDVRLGVQATGARREGDAVILGLATGEEIAAQRLLVAVGRKPLTAGLGLESLGLSADGPIEVDERMQVPGHPWLYAIGDVNGRALLTHAGKYQGRIAAENILGFAALARSDGPASPRVIFTRPQVAAVGLTLAEARKAGHPAHAVDVPTSGSAGASFYGRGAPGTSRFVVDTELHILLGATFVGPEVSEFLQAATIAVTARVPLGALAHAMAPFPTRSELWLKFLESYEQQGGLTLHADEVARVHWRAA